MMQIYNGFLPVRGGRAWSLRQKQSKFRANAPNQSNVRIPFHEKLALPAGPGGPADS
jgi:hypothetical protein